jgi:hypothetical protein
MRSLLAKLLLRIFPFLALGLVLLRIYPRDLLPGLAGIYYLTPTPLIAAVFLFPAFLHALWQRRTRPLVLYGLGSVLLAAWPFRGVLFPPPEVDLPADSRKVVFWTPDHYQFTSVDEGFAYLRGFDADIIGLVEGSVDIGRQRWRASELFPNYTMELLDYSMLVFHRGRTLERSFTFVGDGRGALSTVEFALPDTGQPLRIALYDQVSNPFLHRKDSLREAVRILMEKPDLPTLLMGDFNLPKSSLLLRPVREHFQATQPRGRLGLPHTYPRFLPLVTIDQVWTRGNFTLHDARILDTTLSWHRPIVLNLSLHGTSGRARKPR